MKIRLEQPGDYHAIATVNAITFSYSNGMGEVPLISVLRNRATFDPGLSLVAELNGEIIGHALFTPQQVRVKGETLHAVILAPIAVHPDFQKRGVGSMLIEEGHKRAAEKCFQFSLLLGHSAYYPRFGYRTNMFGSSHIRIHVKDIPAVPYSVKERRIESGDVAELSLMWERLFGDSNLALMPGRSIVDWISYGRGIKASAITIDEKLVGYIRYEVKDPGKIIFFLADHRDHAIAILSYMKAKIKSPESELLLPIHPVSRGVKELGNLPYQSEIKAGKASMIKILDPSNHIITGYCDEIDSGSLSPGTVIWPVEFDVL